MQRSTGHLTAVTPSHIRGANDIIRGDCLVTKDESCYIKALKKLSELVHQTIRKLLFVDINATPHSAQHITDKIVEFGQTVLPHPPCSPDLASSDFHLWKVFMDIIWEQLKVLWTSSLGTRTVIFTVSYYVPLYEDFKKPIQNATLRSNFFFFFKYIG